MLIEKFVESENIRRFVFIPLIFSLFLFFTQLIQKLATTILLNVWPTTHSLHDTYFVIVMPFSIVNTFAQFLPGIVVGLVIGLGFSALDYRMHLQKDLDGSDCIRNLLRNLLFSGAFAWLAILVYIVTIAVPALMWPINHRYHAYPPEMQLVEKLAVLPPLFIAIALLWAMVKTLWRYKPRKFSALSE